MKHKILDGGPPPAAIKPLPQKPRPRWQEIVARVAAALRETLTAAVLTFCYDIVLVVIAFVALALTEAGHSKNPSLEGTTLILLVGTMLGALVALGFAAKRHYWRALGVVLGLTVLFWLAQNI